MLLSFDPIAWAVLGVAGVLAGLAGLLAGRRGAALVALVTAGALAVLGGVAWASGQAGWLWEPLLVLSAVEVGLAVLRLPRVWAWLRRPALQSAAVLLAGTGL